MLNKCCQKYIKICKKLSTVVVPIVIKVIKRYLIISPVVIKSEKKIGGQTELNGNILYPVSIVEEGVHVGKTESNSHNVVNRMVSFYQVENVVI